MAQSPALRRLGKAERKRAAQAKPGIDAGRLRPPGRAKVGKISERVARCVVKGEDVE